MTYPINVQVKPVVFTETIQPGGNSNFGKASFTFNIPGDGPIRYLLVLLPGYNQSGEHLATDTKWVETAKATGGALVACTFIARPKQDQSIHYAAAKYGSGKALETAVQRAGERISMPGLKDLPFFMYGHSAGGQFAYGYSCYNPTRLMAFVSVKGGIFFPEPTEETYRIPGLIISGEKDLEKRKTAIKNLFETHRERLALWCWMEEKDRGHEEGQCLLIGILYLKSILHLRREQGGGWLEKIDPSMGIWVDTLTQKQIRMNDISVLSPDITRVGWLPGKKVYEKWKSLDNGPGKYNFQ